MKNKRAISSMLAVLFMPLFISCTSSAVDQKPPPITISSPTPTAFLILVSTKTSTPTPEAALIEPTSTPSLDPSIPLRVPASADNMKLWGWEGYQIWASNNPLVSCSGGDVTDFACGDNPNKNIYHWFDTSPWYFAGQARLESQLTTTEFLFDQPYLNIVITGNNDYRWAIDSIYGILIDGSEVPFGYAIRDGVLVAVPLYFDTPSDIRVHGIDYYINLEKKKTEPGNIKDCGIVGKNPDNSVIIMDTGVNKKGPFIIFRMLNRPNAWGNYRGEQAYKLIGIKITAGKYSSRDYHTCDSP